MQMRYLHRSKHAERVPRDIGSIIDRQIDLLKAWNRECVKCKLAGVWVPRNGKGRIDQSLIKQEFVHSDTMVPSSLAFAGV